MIKSEFEKRFINHSLGSGILHCEKDKVETGLEKLNELITKAQEVSDDNKTIFSEFRNLPRFNGFVQGGHLGEDNLFFDLEIPSSPNADPEHLDDIINPHLVEIKELLETLKTDITGTVEAIEAYNNNDMDSSELVNFLDKITLYDDYTRLNVSPDDIQSQSSTPSVARRSVYTSNVKPTKVPTLETASLSPNTEQKIEAPITNVSSLQEQVENIPLESNDSNISTNTSVDLEDDFIQEQEIPTTNNVVTDFTGAGLSNTTISKVPVDSSISLGNPKAVATSVKDTFGNKEDIISTIKNSIPGISSTTAGSLVSSIIKKSSMLKPIQTDSTNYMEENTSLAGTFTPPIAGLATAGTAGVGTKMYLDKKNKKTTNNEFIDIDKTSKDDEKEVKDYNYENNVSLEQNHIETNSGFKINLENINKEEQGIDVVQKDTFAGNDVAS